MSTYYVGWDVGAWNCSGGKNPQSHDAIAVFDKDFNFVSCGLGNIKASLLNSTNFADFLSKFAVLDKEKNKLPIAFYKQNDRFIIAIDAVLGWPKNFLRLITEPDILREELEALFPNGASIGNKFLFRQTEREVGTTKMPLSAVKDQIGSQSTKAIFLLKYLGFSKEGCSAWKDKDGNIAIETYPGAVLVTFNRKIPNELNCIQEDLSEYRLSYSTKGLKKDLLFSFEVSHDGKTAEAIDIDLQDAIVCSWIAKTYKKEMDTSIEPYASEGRIWLP